MFIQLFALFATLGMAQQLYINHSNTHQCRTEQTVNVLHVGIPGKNSAYLDKGFEEYRIL